ncbi:MAG: tRNA (adenosine(37)-N6)-threonylcarbamoyltransferase complex ATPase subunit type 1 TsaE, partial [Alkalinema sp. RU_4_3]|nr:tRNA (adenosine(37)-N6)-threonylcarbamoyltransferase complex ATPase subunit type 1 TsaE [Alkalinema sp. RU_4_3]
MNELTGLLRDAAATRALGLYLGARLTAGSCLLLAGDLGAGKTSLIQGLGLGLGITESIDSPTFTLINEYLDGRLPLYHLDLYRLEPSEVAALYLENYWEAIEVDPGITAIEWPECLAYGPDCFLQVELTHRGEGRGVVLRSGV